jgi:23S rRNA (cytidine2498-2'-O)-methyltransferase
MTDARGTANFLLRYCRAGFEGECAQEIAAWAAGMSVAGAAAAGSGFVVFGLPRDAADSIDALTDWRRAIFARQSLVAFAHLAELPRADRLTPIMAALAERGERYCDAWVEAPETDEGKALAPFCKSFGNALIGGLKKARLLEPAATGRSPSATGRSPSAAEAKDGRERPAEAKDGRERPAEPKDGQERPATSMDGRERPLRRLHAFFPQSNNVYLCAADPRSSAPWPQGIPRLKFPREAPSRSTLKLEEALLTLLDAGERERWLKPGMNAVDLGAAPGGWTWQLVRRSLRVTAVDNGPMAAALMQSGLVAHVREDGFRFRPKKPVDWMVCDMVEQPRRIAELVARWFADGWCRHSIFNLKLPMKKRWEEVQRCRGIIDEALGGSGYFLRMKQLYHDREEVTCYLARQRKALR